MVIMIMMKPLDKLNGNEEDEGRSERFTIPNWFAG